MNPAITTRFLHPTACCKTRVRAFGPALGPPFSATFPWDYNLGDLHNHEKAAAELLARHNLEGEPQIGAIYHGYAFTYATLVEKEPKK